MLLSHTEVPVLSRKPCSSHGTAFLRWCSPHPKLCFLSVLPPHLPLTSATFASPWATWWATTAAFSQEPWLWLGVELRSMAKLGKLSFAPYLPFITGVTPLQSVTHRLTNSALTSSTAKISFCLSLWSENKCRSCLRWCQEEDKRNELHSSFGFISINSEMQNWHI